MDIYTTIAGLRDALDPQWRAGADIGFVPSLGALHEGHLSHVRRARARDAVVVCSVFLNPTQFGPSDDLTRYPRTPARDEALLRDEGVDHLFMPSADEMYPAGFATRVDVGPLGAVLEGAERPGHFAGVATVVAKLLNIVRPTHAYFGQKDAQQLAVLRRMVRDLDMPVEIVAGPTVRESDSLAMSSRNVYLSPDERRAAPALYRALTAARDRSLSGPRDGEGLRRAMREVVATEPLVRLEYAELVDPDTMEALEAARPGALLVIAARVGATRLIDNLPL
ncbi:MAG: pantoate--beta-alanine ligase [Chloroflexi bacterium]|nr:pantoate--beta-alanine ligase [Chloroflexota bacterium]